MSSYYKQEMSESPRKITIRFPKREAEAAAHATWAADLDTEMDAVAKSAEVSWKFTRIIKAEELLEEKSDLYRKTQVEHTSKKSQRAKYMRDMAKKALGPVNSIQLLNELAMWEQLYKEAQGKHTAALYANGKARAAERRAADALAALT